MKYRKKPVTVEAFQFHGTRESAAHIIGWAAGVITDNGNNTLAVHTMEGIMKVSPQDFVIKGVKGEFYPCKPDIFFATYEPVRDGEE